MSSGNQPYLELHRTNSICPTPEEVLLESVKRNDIENIRSLVSANRKLLLHKYEDFEEQTILIIACSKSGIGPQTVETLLDLQGSAAGNTHWCPLHEAAINPNVEILKTVLRKLKSGQINETLNGNNALHALIKNITDNENDFVPHIELLLRNGINVNDGDGKNATPILWAARKGFKHIIKILIERSINHIDLDNHKLANKTARELITEKQLYSFPLPGKLLQRYDLKEQLFSLIKTSQEEPFLELFPRKSDDILKFKDQDDGTFTFLQYACDKGLEGITTFLIDHEVDVNRAAANADDYPLMLASKGGYFNIFQKLLGCSEINFTRGIICELTKKFDQPKLREYNIDHEQCLYILLDKMQRKEVNMDVNEEDDRSNTAIHYSLRYCNEETTKKLLEMGASLACKNTFGLMPIEEIKPELLERHLDDCIQFDQANKHFEKQDFEVSLQYRNLLLPPKETRKEIKFKDSELENAYHNYYESALQPETDAIYYMCKAPELKHLLNHPVIVSFLFMKWHKIRAIFYTNLLFYTLFVSALITYIFTSYVFGNEEASKLRVITTDIALILLYITFFVLVLRELFQMIVSPRNYFKNFENLIENILIIITALILFINSPSTDTRKQLSAIAILLAAFELILMVGQHPKFSTNVVMLKTVSMNFFKLLLWYAVLIIAFAFSFYILFATPDEHQVGNVGNQTEEVVEENSFTGAGKSIFKTIIMLTGEFDAGSINFQTFPIVSKLIFSLFVFMITIILLNLLNGLAVSDTQAIKNDAELVGHIARAKHIYYVENMFLGNIVPTSLIKIISVFCCIPCNWDLAYNVLRPLAHRICLFGRTHELSVFPNKGGRILLQSDTKNNSWPKCLMNCNGPHLDKANNRRIYEIVRAKCETKDNQNFTLHNLFAYVADLKQEILLLRSELRESKNKS